MSGLIETTDLDARHVDYEDSGQAQAAIDDASAVARLYVAPTLDEVDSSSAPAALKAIVVGMARRVLTNPTGLAQESLGDYSYATGGNAVATLLPTARERRLLRQVAAAYAKAQGLTPPAYGAGGVYLQADLPFPKQEDVGL